MDWCDEDGNCYQGSYPGAPPQCGSIYQNSAFAFNDDDDYSLIENPTFAAQLQAMGCLNSIFLSLPPAPPVGTAQYAPPVCGVDLFTRPVGASGSSP